jgi:hypothetical protein
MSYRLLRLLDEDGTRAAETPTLYFNGYLVAERLLEDVVVTVTLQDDDLVCTLPPTLPKALNRAHLEAEAKDIAKTLDLFSTTPDLDDDDGVIWNTQKSYTEQEASFTDIPVIENGAPLPNLTPATAPSAPKAVPVRALSIKDLLEKL